MVMMIQQACTLLTGDDLGHFVCSAYVGIVYKVGRSLYPFQVHGSISLLCRCDLDEWDQRCLRLDIFFALHS